MTVHYEDIGPWTTTPYPGWRTIRLFPTSAIFANAAHESRDGQFYVWDNGWVLCESREAADQRLRELYPSRSSGLRHDDGTPVVHLRERVRQLEQQLRERPAKPVGSILDAAREDGVNACISALTAYHDEVESASVVSEDLKLGVDRSLNVALNALCTALDRLRELAAPVRS